jgi:hypothetical protein
LATGIWKGQVRVGRNLCKSKRVSMGWTDCHKLFFYVCRCWSTRVNQELDAGPHGSKQFTIHSVTDFEPGQYGIKPYRPGSTRIDPHRSPCQFLMDSRGTIRRRKICLCSKFLYGFQFRTDVHIDTVLAALTSLTLNLHCPLCRGFWQGFTSGSKRM